jgi:nucleoside-diphosphate kinase
MFFVLFTYGLITNTLSFSGPSEAYILAREDAIAVWRRLMGPTKVFQSQLSHPDCIRARHGLTDTRNATHGSGDL